jgi:hypothetical protein
MEERTQWPICPVPIRPARHPHRRQPRSRPRPGQAFHRLRAQVPVAAREQAGLDVVVCDLPGVAALGCDASASDNVFFP